MYNDRKHNNRYVRIIVDDIPTNDLLDDLLTTPVMIAVIFTLSLITALFIASAL
jgi:hypothetical protein